MTRKALGALPPLVAALWGVSCGVSCSRALPVRATYAPGDRLVLVCQGGFITQDPAQSCEFGELELPIAVSASPRPACLDVRMTQRRLVTGNSYVDEDGNRHVDAWDSTDPSGKLWGSEADTQELLEQTRTFDLRATVGPGGVIVDFAGGMAGMEQRLKEAQTQQADPRKRLQLPRMLWGRYLTVLEDSLAYLPPGPIRVGQSWPVHRPMVFPLHEYGFGMAAGAVVVSEDATCRVQEIRPTPQGRLAVIQISGWRSYIPGLVYQQRLRTMVCRGELQLNIDTGRIVSQSVETRCNFKPGEFPVDVIFYSRLRMLAAE